MKKFKLKLKLYEVNYSILFLICFLSYDFSLAQCTLTNSSDCECLNPNEVDCDLLPDITIEWDMAEAQNTEYAPGDEGPEGRLRISGHTPNIGVGPLNLRGLDENGYRWMICTDANGIPDTFQVYDPTWSIQTYCPDGSEPKHIVFQRIYHKNVDGTMSYWDKTLNSNTYHPNHGHMHLDDWFNFSLRVQDPNSINPLDWPIISSSSMAHFCIMDLSNCVNNNCRDNPTEYGQGNILSGSDFPNYGLGGGSYGCDPVSQGLSSGYSTISGEYLNGMWINIPVGTCNGEYAVVIEVARDSLILESNKNNNYTWFPITLTEQTASPSASISVSGSTMLCPGETVTLNANSNSGSPSYQWYDSNGPISGANSAFLDVSQSGSYSVEVADPSFGSCSNSSSNYIEVDVAPTPVDLNLAALVDAPLFEVQSASGSYQLCNNNSIMLEVVNANTSSASYSWSNGNTGPTASIDSVGDYTVTVTDNSFPCPSTISNVISVSSPIASPQISSSMDTICLGDDVALSSSSGSLTNWYLDAAGLNTISSGSNFIFTPAATTTIYATSTVDGGMWVN